MPLWKSVWTKRVGLGYQLPIFALDQRSFCFYIIHVFYYWETTCKYYSSFILLKWFDGTSLCWASFFEGYLVIILAVWRLEERLLILTIREVCLALSSWISRVYGTSSVLLQIRWLVPYEEVATSWKERITVLVGSMCPLNFGLGILSHFGWRVPSAPGRLRSCEASGTTSQKIPLRAHPLLKSGKHTVISVEGGGPHLFYFLRRSHIFT